MLATGSTLVQINSWWSTCEYETSIDSRSKLTMSVFRSLLFTVFKRTSGANCGRSVQIPNIVLNSLWVENISRSKAMSEQLEIDVSFDTSFDDIQILKDELTKFVTDKDNSRDFQPQFDIGILGTSDQSKLMLQVEIRHKSNWGNETVRQARRSKFMCALVSALKAVPIYPPGGGGDPLGAAANPSYSVAVSDAVAKENVNAATKARLEARLVPTKMSPTSSGQSGAAGLTDRDNRIVDDLTSRNPAFDPARDQAWTSSREDDSTLGERPSIDRQDLEEVRGVLRRESTRGKRKPSSETSRYQQPSVPTIREPNDTSYADYAQAAPYGGYQSTGYSNQQTAYRPNLNVMPSQTMANSQSSVPQLPQLSTATSPIEMRQVVSRNPSNPYRKRTESLNRKPLSPTGNGEKDAKDGSFENTRPYSGV
jgi:hypothetical protein